MKLQLMAEDISLALEEQSVSGLRRIPRAVAEIERVEHDTKSLQSRIQGILRRLDDAEGASRDSVRTLASVDKVKARMEHARETLANAAGLADEPSSDVRRAPSAATRRRDAHSAGDLGVHAPRLARRGRRPRVRGRALARRSGGGARRRSRNQSWSRREGATRSRARRGDARRFTRLGKIQTVFSAYAETRVVEPLRGVESV